MQKKIKGVFMEDTLNCFGHFSVSEKKCSRCSYQASCRYYGATESVVSRRLKLASYERVEEWLGDAADYDHIPGEEKENTPPRLTEMLGRFFRYLLDLDDYTVGVITEVVAPSDPKRECSVAALGKVHGCSRQAMHRKILYIIGKHPELSLLFREMMYKLGSARQRFLRQQASGGAVAAAGN